MGTVVVVRKVVLVAKDGGATVARVEDGGAGEFRGGVDALGALSNEFSPRGRLASEGTSRRTSRPIEVSSCALRDIIRKRRHAPGRSGLVILHHEAHANLS